MKFIVTEVQKWESGAIQTPTYAYDDRNSAEAKFYSILSVAAKSTLPVHSCIMYTEEGSPLMNKCYLHPVVPPEPEPDSTEEDNNNEPEG